MNRGFSLVETVFAGFIISLVTMAIFALFPTSAMTAKRAEMHMVADGLAQSRLEQMRSLEFDTLTLGVQPVVPPHTSGGTAFTTRVEVLADPGSDPEVLKIARATVVWRHSGREHSVVHEAWLISVRP